MTTADKATALDQSDGLLLPGIDGTNPLGFLAALGVLRVLDFNRESVPVYLQWEQRGGTWMPRVFNGGDNLDEMLNQLTAALDTFDNSPWSIDTKLPFDADQLRKEMLDAASQSSCNCRDRADTLASLGVEYVRNDKGVFKDTSLRMVRAGDSAGNGLLAYAKRIIEECTEADLRSALTTPWTYEDERCALRWDPAEYHGYATQWANPSSETTVSVRGGNRLGLAGMQLLPTMPYQVGVATAAFGRPMGKGEHLTWPLWNMPCPVDVARSLLALSVLQEERPSPETLRAMGIGAICRCERIMTSTYYRNFTPAQRIG